MTMAPQPFQFAIRATLAFLLVYQPSCVCEAFGTDFPLTSSVSLAHGHSRIRHEYSKLSPNWPSLRRGLDVGGMQRSDEGISMSSLAVKRTSPGTLGYKKASSTASKKVPNTLAAKKASLNMASKKASTTTIAAKTAASAATAAACACAPLPSLRTVALACLLPTCLGYVKSEYGVSYGYGGSVAITSYLVLRALPLTTTATYAAAAWHANALVFYGTRLSLFLLSREMFIPRFRKFRDRIEERAVERGNRLRRTPFVLSCAALYGCMCAPVFVTAKTALAGNRPTLATMLLVGGTWVGFLLAALGDMTKSMGKARRGEDALITGGVLRLLRHPNYTGEAFGWTCSCAAAFAAVAGAAGAGRSSWATWRAYIPLLAASASGLAGILFVLAGAASGLELKQKETYGGTEEYEEWIEGSWAGITIGGWRGTTKKSDSTAPVSTES